MLAPAVGLTAPLILHHGYVPRPTGLALAFWLLLCIISLLSTLCNPLHPGWAIKLSRLLLIDGWCFVGGTYVATRKQSLAAFMNVFLIVCLAVALSVFLSGERMGTSVAQLSFINYLGVGRLTAMATLLCLARMVASVDRKVSAAYTMLAAAMALLTFSAGGRGPSLGLLLVLAGWALIALYRPDSGGGRKRLLLMVMMVTLVLWLGTSAGLLDATLARWNQVNAGAIGGSGTGMR